jgi:hypothetical protein
LNAARYLKIERQKTGPRMELQVLALFSIAAYILTIWLIPKITHVLIAKGRFGKDLLKPEQPIM